jgi:hypothetical protein
LDITSLNTFSEGKNIYYLVSLLPSFYIKDIGHVIHLEKCIRQVLTDLTSLSDTGYVSGNAVNIPIVYKLLNHLGLDDDSYKNSYKKSYKKSYRKASKQEVKKEKDFSLFINVIYYNLLLLIMSYLITKIELWMKEEYLLKPNTRYLDAEADVKTTKLMTSRMINPVIKDKLSNRGISLIFNTYAGYDSEYELVSSLNKTNELLSIQLAVNTGMYIKVPIIDKEPLKTLDFDERYTIR